LSLRNAAPPWSIETLQIAGLGRRQIKEFAFDIALETVAVGVTASNKLKRNGSSAEQQNH
jgi:hypothetical protein